MNKFIICGILLAFSCLTEAETLFDALCAKDGISSRQYVRVDGDKYLSCGGRFVTNGIWTGLPDLDDGAEYLFFIKEPGVQNGNATALLTAKNGYFINGNTGIRSSIMSVEVDCQNSRYRHMQSLHYSGRMGNGKLLVTQRFALKWINDPLIAKTFCINK